MRDHFKKMLSAIDQLNKDTANEISRFAQMYHHLAAGEIVSVIDDFIRDVSIYLSSTETARHFD